MIFKDYTKDLNKTLDYYDNTLNYLLIKKITELTQYDLVSYYCTKRTYFNSLI